MWRRLLLLAVILEATLGSSGVDVTAHGACIRAIYTPILDPRPLTWIPRPTSRLAAQWTPQPGNPGHQPPPPGWYCTHNAQDAAHQCSCHRACELKQGEDENGNQTEELVIIEDAQCVVYCAKDHCHCTTDCP